MVDSKNTFIRSSCLYDLFHTSLNLPVNYLRGTEGQNMVFSPVNTLRDGTINWERFLLTDWTDLKLENILN